MLESISEIEKLKFFAIIEGAEDRAKGKTISDNPYISKILNEGWIIGWILKNNLIENNIE